MPTCNCAGWAARAVFATTVLAGFALAVNDVAGAARTGRRLSPVDEPQDSTR